MYEMDLNVLLNSITMIKPRAQLAFSGLPIRCVGLGALLLILLGTRDVLAFASKQFSEHINA